MGPRLDGRGNGDGVTFGWPSWPRFNGATPGWAWEYGEETLKGAYHVLLQWGHAWMGVGIRILLSHGVVFRPLQWGHAWMGVGIRGGGQIKERRIRFNGATPGWAWESPRTHDARARDTLASMGPRLDGRGNIISIAALERFFSASMGPRLDGRGNRPPPAGRTGRIRGFNGATPGWAWESIARSYRDPRGFLDRFARGGFRRA